MSEKIIILYRVQIELRKRCGKVKIAVAGTGYVGLVTGVGLAHVGHQVTCVDVDQKKIESMKKGISPIYEQDLEQLMHENKDRLSYTTDYQEAYKDAEVIFIGVGTPERSDGSANLDYVFSVVKQIASSIEHDTVIVVKSTVPIGTNDKIEEELRKNLKNKVNVYVVSNPEFLAQGTAVRDTLHASRIVVGTEDEYAKKVMKKLYEPFTREPYHINYISMNRKSAEMVKYASNNFLALKVSFINDIANLCEIVGADIEKVTKGMSFDSRIGDKFLNAGCGYGGSCFPKDTKALHYLAGQCGYELKTVKAAIDVNKKQKIILIEKARKRFKSFSHLNVAVLGLTFKAGTDDLREAPSIDNIKILLEEQATIKVYDPVGMENYKKIYPQELQYMSDIESTLKDADVCFIFTDWSEFKKLNASIFTKFMKRPVIFDGRNLFELENMKNIEYYSIGRK